MKIKKIVSSMIAAVMLAVVFSFSTVSVMVMAADKTPVVNVKEASVIEPEATLESVPLVSLENANFKTAVLSAKIAEMPAAIMLDAALDSRTDGDEQFESVIRFFVKWIKRIGLVVAFVGGVMFGLAIKNNDAEQKQSGLLTLIAGFVVAALCQAVDMFGIFS